MGSGESPASGCGHQPIPPPEKNMVPSQTAEDNQEPGQNEGYLLKVLRSLLTQEGAAVQTTTTPHYSLHSTHLTFTVV